MIYDMGWGGRIISKIFLTMIAKSTFQSSKLLVIFAYRKSRIIEINVNEKVNIYKIPALMSIANFLVSKEAVKYIN